MDVLDSVRKIDDECRRRGWDVAVYLADMLLLEIAEKLSSSSDDAAGEMGDVPVEPGQCGCVCQG